jgi:DNA-directed RNA polymerase I subunit RPA2
MTRRNYPLCLKRGTWTNRGKFFSDFGIMIRCVSLDHTATNNVLHFLNNGTVKMMFSHRKTLSYLPVMLLLKSLISYTDEKIFKDLISGFEGDLYYKSCLQNMLVELHKEGIHTHIDCKITSVKSSVRDTRNFRHGAATNKSATSSWNTRF